MSQIITNKHDSGKPSLVRGRELEFAFRGRQQEGDAQDLDGIAGVGKATHQQEEIVEFAITLKGKQSIYQSTSIQHGPVIWMYSTVSSLCLNIATNLGD